jgi:hypothetical protein
VVHQEPAGGILYKVNSSLIEFLLVSLFDTGTATDWFIRPLRAQHFTPLHITQAYILTISTAPNMLSGSSQGGDVAKTSYNMKTRNN